MCISLADLRRGVVAEGLREVRLVGEDGLRAPVRSSWGSVSSHAGDTDWVDGFFFELASGIAAGSSNIQRNVIGERGLGLPRDLRAG